MTVSQSEFIEAVCNPELPVPTGITSRTGRDTKRFAVYRNNVVVSLIDALEGAFPVTCKLVGSEFFKAMSGEFVRKYPPKSPLMMFFASEFPEFLESFEPVQSLPYLPDVARLELALRESYHAADRDPASPQAFASIPQDKLVDAKVELAPSFRLLKSDFPIFSIWTANVSDGPKPRPMAEEIAVVRQQFDPTPRLLGKGEYEFLQMVMSGDTLGHAFETALMASPAFELDGTLAWLIGTNLVTGVGITLGGQD